MKMIKMMKFFCFSIVMEHQWNEIDRGKSKYSEQNLSQCHFVYHKSHMDRTRASAMHSLTFTVFTNRYRPAVVTNFNSFLFPVCCEKEMNIPSEP
jgi:hypothetical protein